MSGKTNIIRTVRAVVENTRRKVPEAGKEIKRSETGQDRNLILQKFEKWKDRGKHRMKTGNNDDTETNIQEEYNKKGPKQPCDERDVEL